MLLKIYSQVGAVGLDNPADYNNWGSKVMQAARVTMDFYIIHP
jgi:hypothetical protein